jgi:hypothetical protein
MTKVPHKIRMHLWNPEVHTQWGKERLYFWCLHFKPTFDQDAIFTALKRVFAEKKILSYALYEATGQWDFFLRLWLPTLVTPDDLEQALQEVLGPHHLNSQDRFRVSEIAQHWVWSNENGHQVRIAKEALSRPLEDHEIANINNGGDGLSKHQEKGLIASCRPSKGIKFIIVVSSEERQINSQPDLRRAIADRLKSVLANSQHILEKSLYIGEGLGQFLLLGRVQHRHFEAIYNELVSPINQPEVRNFFKIRTYTYIVVRSPSYPGYFQDQLATSSEITSADDAAIEEYLSRSEDEKLEFKGSAWTDIKQWIVKDEFIRNEQIFNEGVLRAIVSMLNSAGGKIVIGVLEKQKFKWKEALEKLSDSPSFGDNIIFGINREYGKKDWDWYHLRLQDLISQRILPTPRAWVSIKRAEFREKDLCIISIRKPSDFWFYLKDDARFWVREGASSRELPGPEADIYKQASPRR